MKAWTKVVALSACLLVSAPLLAGSTGESAAKATGQVWFENGGLWATLEFNAHEAMGNRPAKGHLYYADWDGSGMMRYYKAWIDCVDVEGDEATFSGQIYETNVPAWMDQGVQIWVHDGGTPGRNGDEIGGNFFTWPGCLPYMAPPQWIPVEEGNLKVH